METSNGLDGSLYYFDDIAVDRGTFEVRRSGEHRSLTPRAFDVLVYLIRERDRVVEKQELFEQVWKESFVTDNSLTRVVKEIRRELGDSAAAPKYIETVHKRGYRFIGTVNETRPAVIDPRHPAADGFSGTGAVFAEISKDTATPEIGNTSSIHRYAVAAIAIALLIFAAAAALYLTRIEKEIRSIVVLPLENANGEADLDYISDGITESLINSLSEMPQLKVVARATAFRYRGQESDPQKLRRDLGVDAVLTGKIVRRGEELTIQADLIDASDGSQVWGSRYTRKLAATYELHGAIAIDLSNKLGLNLTADQTGRLTKNFTENTEAYHLNLLGRYFWNKRSEENLNKSIEYFQQAIEKDPNYAVAYAGLADSYAVMAISADLPAHEVFPKAKIAAAKALELDDTLVETHATMLRIKSQYDWDWTGVETEYRRALELNPNYPMTHVYYISYLMAAGRMDEAVVSIKRAQELDPLSLVINAVVARALFFADRQDEAIAAARKTLELDDKVFLARLILGRSLARKGMYDDAIAELKKAKSLPGTVSEASSLLAYSYAVSGRRAEAQQVLGEMTQLSKRRYVQPYDFAIVHAGLGNRDRALEWLEKAHADKNHQITLITVVPEFESLRSDPRFERLVAQTRSGR